MASFPLALSSGRGEGDPCTSRFLYSQTTDFDACTRRDLFVGAYPCASVVGLKGVSGAAGLADFVPVDSQPFRVLANPYRF